MTVSLNGTTGVTFPDASVQNTAATGFGFKNRIINGAMVIDQRNAGASVTNTSSGNVWPVDRWAAYGSVSSKFTAQQSTTVPTGFKNSIVFTSLSAYTVGASEFFQTRQAIEGFNVADLGWGSVGAASVTLSFWVRSSLTGIFGGSIGNNAADRSYPFSYTISSANTWEQKSITIAGDTSGTWLTDNSGGLWLYLGLGVGSTKSGTANTWASSDYRSVTGATSVVGTNGATFYITGVQLEKGSTATSFDYRPYGTELGLCQRYYWLNAYTGYYAADASGYARFYANFPVAMRAAPTITLYGANSSGWTIEGFTWGAAGINATIPAFTPSFNASAEL